MATSKARRERRKHLQTPGPALDMHRRDQRVRQKGLARRTMPTIQLCVWTTEVTGAAERHRLEWKTFTLEQWKRDCPLKNRRDFQPFLSAGNQPYRKAA